MQLLGVIPARAGSKGIPGKNIRPLGGLPLLVYTVIAARRSGICTRIVLSTDSEDIAAIGREHGVEVPFLRPRDLARDDTPMLPVIQHAVRWMSDHQFDAEAVVILQPTAPFRRWQDLQAAFSLLTENPGLDSVVSVEPVPEHYSPHFLMKIEEGRLLPFMPDGLRIARRQDAPRAYARTGDFYFTRTPVLMQGNSIYGENCQPYVVRHQHRVNLDTLEDWAEAERLVASFLKEVRSD